MWTLDALDALTTIFGNTVRLMDSAIIPGTTVTFWGLFKIILLVLAIAFVLRVWLGWEVGAFGSSYQKLRKDGKSPKEAAHYSRSRMSYKK